MALRRVWLLSLLLGCSTPPAPGGDLVVTESTRLEAGRYRAVRIDADNVTVDFKDAELVGSENDPDTFTGMGIVVEGRMNVTIRNARVRGYKVGIYARDCHGLVIEDCDAGGNFAQRLHSTPDHCDEGDWLWPHENDDNEWLKNYGASIALDRCTNAEVRRNRGRRSQNGIVLSRTRDSFVYDNDFSYHSGWGLAMYRSCHNEVSHNSFDYCMRGFSHGKFARGQDSAGILVFEQCSDNVFAFNSATHGGDGFFLYAGHETTQETGEGGSNRNLLYGNDFSHAAANAIEATFSDGNVFANNRLDESNYGVWAGYSYNTRIVGNTMRGDLDSGVAIEHGHDNLIEGNTIENCGVALNLWGGDLGDFAKTPYAKKQRTASDGYTIALNTLTGNRLDLRLLKTTNAFLDFKPVTVESDSTFSTIEDFDLLNSVDAPTVRGTRDAMLSPGARRGLRTILVGEWAPYDYSRVEIVPSTLDACGEATFFLYEPSTSDVSAIGDVAMTVHDTFPRTVTLTPKSTLASFTLRAGDARATGTLYDATWTVRLYEWKSDPRETPIAGDPIVEFTTKQLDFNWGGGAPHDKVPADRFATVATASLTLPAGTYEFTTLSDDGVRLWVGDALVIDNWTWHSPTENTGSITLGEGPHSLRLEHFEIDGWAVLSLKLRRK